MMAKCDHKRVEPQAEARTQSRTQLQLKLRFDSSLNSQTCCEAKPKWFLSNWPTGNAKLDEILILISIPIEMLMFCFIFIFCFFFCCLSMFLCFLCVCRGWRLPEAGDHLVRLVYANLSHRRATQSRAESSCWQCPRNTKKPVAFTWRFLYPPTMR